MLTVAFKRPHERWRRFPQPSLPELESWTQLEELILTGCLRVHTDPQYDAPRVFRVYGSVRTENEPIPTQRWRRLRRGKWKRTPFDVLMLDVELNPLTAEIRVLRSAFHKSFRWVQEDMNLAYGRPLVTPSSRSLVPTTDFDILKAQRMPEPPPNEYGIQEPSDWPPLNNEWRPRGQLLRD